MRSLLAMSLARKITLSTRSKYLIQKSHGANVKAMTIDEWLQVEDLRQDQS
jgi:hypothetical protein